MVQEREERGGGGIARKKVSREHDVRKTKESEF